MRNKNAPHVLPSYDSIFGLDNSETVLEISLIELHTYEGHPFRVTDDSDMMDMAESIKQLGVLTPGVARSREAGGYEIISGHRRKRACELAEIPTMPMVIREMDDDEAIIILVESNLQREIILPSEKAFAYKMKMEALKRQSGRRTKNPVQLDQNLAGRVTRDVLGEKIGDSGSQVSRYIRLTELIPELLSRVDEKNIAFIPAVELSYLEKEEQQLLLEVIELLKTVPSLLQAQTLKQHSQKELLTFETIKSIMSVEKRRLDRVTFKSEVLKKYFPASFTPLEMEETIIKLLEDWAKKNPI